MSATSRQMGSAIVDLFRELTKLGVALILNAHGLLVIVKQNPDDLLLTHNVQVGVVTALELVVHISVSSILPPPVWADVLQPSLGGVVRVEVLQVLQLAIAHLVSRVDEGLFGFLAAVGALGNVDGAAVSVGVSVTQSMVVLELAPN